MLANCLGQQSDFDATPDFVLPMVARVWRLINEQFTQGPTACTELEMETSYGALGNGYGFDVSFVLVYGPLPGSSKCSTTGRFRT